MFKTLVIAVQIAVILVVANNPKIGEAIVRAETLVFKYLSKKLNNVLDYLIKRRKT